MSSIVSKKFLIEQAEQDRLQQRQLRERSPKLQAMVRFLDNIREITDNKKLTAKEQLNSISDLQIEYDKLKKEIKLLRGTLPLQCASEASPETPLVQPKVLADKGIGPEINPKKKSKRSNMRYTGRKR